jgi:hypothetical protein
LSIVTSVQVSKIVRPGIEQGFLKFDGLILKNGSVYTQQDSALLTQNANVIYYKDNTQLRWYLVSYSQSKKMML